MKHLLKTLNVLIVSSLAGSTMLFAQCTGWNWPDNKAKAEEQVAILQDAVNGKKYKQAIKPFNWLLANTPKLNTSIYIHGTTIYDALATREKNAAIKKKYLDSLMIVYDLRIARCGENGNVLNRKALASYKHFINGPEATKVLPLMDSALKYNDTAIMESTLIPYMQTIVITESKFKILTQEDVLMRYESLIKIIDAKMRQAIADQKAQARLKKIKKDVDELLFKVVKPDCDFVRKNLAPKFMQNPDDLTLAKRIFTFMLQGKCTEDPLWLKASEVIFVTEKDFGLGKNIAVRYLAKNETEKADRFLNETLAIAPSTKDSSEVYFYKGIIESKKSNKPKAREYYLLSVKLDATRVEAYERIGDLYYGSFSECAQKQRQADDRAIYLAAYDYYARARNQKKMGLAKQSFPSKEEIFLLNYKNGDKLKVGCWIGEEVTLRTRD